MKTINSLRDVIKINSNFKTAINLYLNLNKPEKINSYIPTKSSVVLLNNYLKAIIEGKEQASLLVGPYGKGKSHLLLVLLAVISLERNKENSAIINHLLDVIRQVDEIGNEACENINKIWNKNRFLPVLITDTTGDLNQSFLLGLNEALKRNGVSELIPNTYYSIAIDRLTDWKKNYAETYNSFSKELESRNMTVSELKAELKLFSKKALGVFRELYPRVTAGSKFSPLAVSEVLPLYKSTSEALVEDYQYSGIYIVFDEFSKFIESQDGMAAGANMKLIQDVCELAADSQNSQIHFTMVAHKSIKEYGKYLSQDIINSFTGIEGRIVEKLFVTSSKNNYELIRSAILKNEDQLVTIPGYNSLFSQKNLDDYFGIPAFRSSFLRDEFERIIFRGCYPLNPVAAYLLLNVSEKVAQNERTLFTFISNDEPHSMARFVKDHNIEMGWSIGADLIYDYFEPIFKKDVTNEFIHNVWLSAKYALEKCNSEEQRKLVKTLAIILIVNKEDELPASETCLKLAAQISDCSKTIAELKNSDFVYQKGSTGFYSFKTRAGSELRTEIKKQREIKGNTVNYGKVLAMVSGMPYVIPRKYNSINKITRYFSNQYMSVDDFLNIEKADAFLADSLGDGKVITLFSFTDIIQNKVKKHVQKLANPRLVVVCPKQGLRIQKQLIDYEIITELLNNQTFTSSNEILKNELPLMIDDLGIELEASLSSIYKEEPSTQVLYYSFGSVTNAKVGNEEGAVNECCRALFTKTPIINNELVNRTIISTSQTRKARINIIKVILSHEDDEEFFKGANQEATVYRSLFTVTHIRNGNPESNLKEILEIINSFIDGCSDKKASLSILISKLTSEPYGLRMGVIPFYLAYVLSNRNEDIITYFSDNEIQLNAEIVVNMCEHPDDYALFVSKEDLQKEKYIAELNVLFQVADNRNLSANRIKDIFICMQRWFRALPQVTRNLININEYIMDEDKVVAMKTMKNSLQKLDFNPYETLFVDYPKVFKTNSLEKTFEVLDECKTFFDDYFDWILEQISTVIYEAMGRTRKNDIYHCLKNWYEKQSKRSKQGLYNGRVTNFMSAIETMNVYSDDEVSKRIAKAVTDVYVDNWNIGGLEKFKEGLKFIIHKIDSIKDEDTSGEMTLSFTRKNGEPFEKTYSYADESTGSVLRNIIEDTLDEYDDLSVNDRVSILLEMIEKITK